MPFYHSKDLRISGVSKRCSSWRYHIEVLDTRTTKLSPLAGSFSSQKSSILRLEATRVSSFTNVKLPPVVRYSVMRRYSEFLVLYQHIMEHYDTVITSELPEFPDGNLWSYLRANDPELLKYRQVQLEKFMRALDEQEALRNCNALERFLAPNSTDLGEDKAICMEASYVSLSKLRSPDIRFGFKRAKSMCLRTYTDGKHHSASKSHASSYASLDWLLTR
uniref:Uncharacterized protein AlNc14C32G2937 n=1 Tax=Albugo laibachii Nc14 TaxID=890382 RepID=F0W7Y7_9STRA|nr:conserved hypothetical protein [Albugo laibachii Nc14]|eukprot:CCA17240.1 conserved hypothetical protein [Albugo laibachii Nc14]